MQPSEALERFQVPTHSNWYTIGFGESRVTLYTQQVRALNLAWALKHSGRLQGGPVVVIGGGAAGLSVAAGLVRLGAQVTILEKEEFLLPLQCHCYKRHLHPHIFDWPDARADNPFANLPLLNWKAGMAREVALSIEAAFRELEFEYGATGGKRLAVRRGVKDVDPDSIAKGLVGFRDGTRTHTLPYDMLIFALGFGVENDFWTGHRGSYWSDDNLDQHGVFPPGRYLVSGTGDGGLIDILRILTRDLRQEDFARLVQGGDDPAPLREALLAIEDEAQAAGAAGAGKILFDAYEKLPSELVRGTDSRLRAQLNRHAHVTLLSKRASPFSLQSRPLHRFLLSRLLFSCSEVLTIRTNVTLTEGMLRHDRHNAVLTFGGESRFDHVVLRHGTASPVVQFPALASALEHFHFPVLGPDPLYEPKEFGPLGRRGGPIAWSGGPREEDYLDELKANVSFVRDGGGILLATDAIRSVYYEVRDSPRPLTQRKRESKPRTKEEVERGEMEDANPETQGLEEGWRAEADELHAERYWRRWPGLALRASSYEMRGVTFLSGRPGTGKTTFLKLVASVALDAHRRGADSKFPVGHRIARFRRRRRGTPWERGAALEALDEDNERRDLVAGRDDLRLVGGLVRSPSRSACHVAMLAHEDESVRLWSICAQPAEFWQRESMQTVLESIVMNDTSPIVRATRFRRAWTRILRPYPGGLR